MNLSSVSNSFLEVQFLNPAINRTEHDKVGGKKFGVNYLNAFDLRSAKKVKECVRQWWPRG